MPDSEPSFWRLAGFYDRLDAWMATQAPDRFVVAAVEHWIESRANNPYEGAVRLTEFENLWRARIKGTLHGGAAVFCTYAIFEETRVVRCDSIGTLSLPA